MRAGRGHHGGRYASWAGGGACWPVFLPGIEAPFG